MNTYKGRTYCDVSHRCANQTCPKILPYVEKKHVDSTGLMVAYHPFKTEFCGYKTVNHDKLEKKHTAIVYSLFMRSLINNSENIHPSVIALQHKLEDAEGFFYKKQDKVYRELVKVGKKAYELTLIDHDNTHIDHFYVLLQLFEDNRGTFISTFGVKEALFIRIYRHFCSKTTFELEQNALKVYKTLVKHAKKELENADFCIY